MTLERELMLSGIERKLVDDLIQLGLASIAGDMSHPLQAHEVASVLGRRVAAAEASRRDWAVEAVNLDALLDHATEFQFRLYPEGHDAWDMAAVAVTVAWRGPGDQWAVYGNGLCYDANGQARPTYERVAFPRDEAIEVARTVVVPMLRAQWDERLAPRSTGDRR